MMKNTIKVSYYNDTNKKQNYGKASLLRRDLYIALKGDDQTLSSIANAIDASLWNTTGISVSVQRGGRTRKNELVIFVSQETYARGYAQKQYCKARLAVYGILASYGVKIQ